MCSAAISIISKQLCLIYKELTIYDQAKNDDDDERLGYYLAMRDENLASNHSFVRNMIEKLGGELLA